MLILIKLLSFAEGHESMGVINIDDLLAGENPEPSTVKATLTAADVLKFFTGGRQPPVIGFGKKISIAFSSDLASGVNISTCFLTAQFPLNFRGTRNEYMLLGTGRKASNAFTSWVFSSPGYGKV